MTKPTRDEPGPRRRRVSISVERGIGEEFSLEAGRTGRPLYSFANEWLATASKISAQGGTADRTEEEWKVLSVFKDAEVIPLPADFVDQIVEGLCRADRERTLKTFGALGDSLANLLRIYAPNIDQLADLAKGFAGIVPVKRLDIERINADSIVLSVVGAGRKYAVTECAFEFVRAVLEGYGYAVTAYELGVGTIRAEAKRRDQMAEQAGGAPGK
jgi:hypothetical protein